MTHAAFAVLATAVALSGGVVSTAPAFAAPPASDPRAATLVDARALELSLAGGFASAFDERAARPAARVEAQPGSRRPAAEADVAAPLARWFAGLPLRVDGGELVFAPDAWRLRLGRGETASHRAGRADLSPTRSVSSAVMAAHRGDVRFRSGGGPTVADVFDDFAGLGRRPRLRLDVELPTASADLAASAAADGDVDLAVDAGGVWRGWTTAARAAATFDRAADGYGMGLQGSAAVRDPGTGWNFTLAAATGEAGSAEGVPATVYAKLGRSRAPAVAVTRAWSVEAAHGRDVGDAGDRAWLAGATLLERVDGVGRVHLRYRYQALSGPGDRRGRAHAVILGARFEL